MSTAEVVHGTTAGTRLPARGRRRAAALSLDESRDASVKHLAGVGGSRDAQSPDGADEDGGEGPSSGDGLSDPTTASPPKRQRSSKSLTRRSTAAASGNNSSVADRSSRGGVRRGVGEKRELDQTGQVEAEAGRGDIGSSSQVDHSRRSSRLLSSSALPSNQDGWRTTRSREATRKAEEESRRGAEQASSLHSDDPAGPSPRDQQDEPASSAPLQGSSAEALHADGAAGGSGSDDVVSSGRGHSPRTALQESSGPALAENRSPASDASTEEDEPGEVQRSGRQFGGEVVFIPDDEDDGAGCEDEDVVMLSQAPVHGDNVTLSNDPRRLSAPPRAGASGSGASRNHAHNSGHRSRQNIGYFRQGRGVGRPPQASGPTSAPASAAPRSGDDDDECVVVREVKAPTQRPRPGQFRPSGPESLQSPSATQFLVIVDSPEALAAAAAAGSNAAAVHGHWERVHQREQQQRTQDVFRSGHLLRPQLHAGQPVQHFHPLPQPQHSQDSGHASRPAYQEFLRSPAELDLSLHLGVNNTGVLDGRSNFHSGSRASFFVQNRQPLLSFGNSLPVVTNGCGGMPPPSIQKGACRPEQDKPDKPASPPQATAPLRMSCPICLDTMKEETSTSCGHLFCKPCITLAVQTNKCCPTCRKKLGKNSFHRVYLG